MASSPNLKVYRDGEYVASVKYAEDAAMLVAGGGQVRYRHRQVIWDTAIDGDTGDSYDTAASLMSERLVKARNQRKPTYPTILPALPVPPLHGLTGDEP